MLIGTSFVGPVYHKHWSVLNLLQYSLKIVAHKQWKGTVLLLYVNFVLVQVVENALPGLMKNSRVLKSCLFDTAFWW